MINKEIVIIGGGPAGLAASIEAAKLGAHVLVVDENSRPGGQLFKQIHKFFGSSAHKAGTRGIAIGRQMIEDAEKNGVEIWLNSPVVGIYKNNVISVLHDVKNERKIVNIEAKKILIATGAQENAVSFDGWTIPGVMGAGAAQTMINVNRVLPGKNVLVVGSGNVGLIVSYQLLQAGANVIGIIEGMDHIGGYAVHAAKIKRAGVDFYLKHTIVKAIEEEGVLSGAIIGQVDDKWKIIPGSEKVLNVDTICIAVGLRPMTEVSMLSGVVHSNIREFSGMIPLHDKNMMTSNDSIYVAGDITGVEEANTAMDEGRIAGVAMAQSLNYISENDGNELMFKINERLALLRIGQFGEKRAKGKIEILRKRAKI